jgi:hypothetical protein
MLKDDVCDEIKRKADTIDAEPGRDKRSMHHFKREERGELAII